MNAVFTEEFDVPRRAMRAMPVCTCGIGPDPGCAIDHTAIAEDRAIATRTKLTDTKWLKESNGDLNDWFDESLWQLFVDGDDIAFAARIRAGLERIALDEVRRIHHDASVLS
jgi:hypothetical protein